MTWACVSSGAPPNVFYADADMSRLPGVYCQPIEVVELEERTAYYVIKGIQALRKKLVLPP